MGEKRLYAWSILSGLVSVGFIIAGFYKILAYNNPYEDDILTSSGDAVNAYVGADAYNLIINGTYATAFSVLAAGFLIVAGLFFLAQTHLDLHVGEVKTRGEAEEAASD
ncbi:hypothetical protein M662_16695 [Bacillus sp. SB49]|uniref:hypothetical protein n=1 Tax=Bacillus sp. SB49 TaxID=1071080 RepID=UPI000429C9C4|nr:hypothetical protein [Bacillus sp. SB49]QHT48047.1 hypothetical protein M662_16695 [Bacillus sp. SB49]